MSSGGAGATPTHPHCLWRPVAPGIQFLFLGMFLLDAEGFGLCPSDQALWSGKNLMESEGSHLWMTAVVGRKQANPLALSKIPLSCQTCKCQSRARNRRLQLSGFCLAFPHLEPPNTLFRTGCVLCGRKALPSVLHCGSHDHCVFCVMPSRRGR